MKILLLYFSFLFAMVESKEFPAGALAKCPGDEHIRLSFASDSAQAMKIADEYALGVCRDKDREWFWLRVATILGSEAATRSLGEILTRPGPGSAEWYEGISLLMRSSESGDAVSSMILADALGSAAVISPADLRRYWLTRSAQQGSTAAMTALARDELDAMPRDEVRLAEALQWATLACRQSMMGSVSHKDACAVRDALRGVSATESAQSE